MKILTQRAPTPVPSFALRRRSEYLDRSQLEKLRPYLLTLFDLHPTLGFGENILDICVSLDGSAAYITTDQKLLEKIQTICCRELGRYIVHNRKPLLHFEYVKKRVYVKCSCLEEVPFKKILEAVCQFLRTFHRMGFDA